MIEFIPLYLKGLLKVFSYFWPALLFAAVQMYRLWRWEKRENERVKKAYKRDNPKRVSY